jgi:hypothetical protein
MNASPALPPSDSRLNANRWQIYHRLQELEIPCHCEMYRPLEVNPVSPSTVLQMWSVYRQTSVPKATLLQWLERCWQIDSLS